MQIGLCVDAVRVVLNAYQDFCMGADEYFVNFCDLLCVPGNVGGSDILVRHFSMDTDHARVGADLFGAVVPSVGVEIFSQGGLDGIAQVHSGWELRAIFELEEGRVFEVARVELFVQRPVLFVPAASWP